MPKSTCKNCNKDFVHVWAHSGTYCSKTCEGVYRSNDHKRKFFSGLLEKPIDRPTARKYLGEARGYNCQVCGLNDWQNQSLVLQVDHIDGNAGNNLAANLRLICPNCHSQTKNYGGGNKGNGRKARGLSLR